MIRVATREDVDAVTALEEAVFGPDAWSAASVTEELTGPRRRAWVAGDPVAAYAVTATAGDVTDLQRIAVAPARRGSGLASAVMGTLLDAARADGAETRSSCPWS